MHVVINKCFLLYLEKNLVQIRLVVFENKALLIPKNDVTENIAFLIPKNDVTELKAGLL